MSKSSKGFTLVELLVVVAIIAILSVIGIAVFTGIQKSARDSKRRGDIEAITKAYEVKYNNTGTYRDLTPTLQENQELFASKQFPKDPKGGDYAIIQNPTSSGFRICATLEDNTSFCKGSIQAEPPPLTGGTSENFKVITAGTGSGLSCPVDGLIGYWDFNEGVGSEVADKMGGRSGIWNGTLGSQWTVGKMGSAGNFNGSNNYVEIPPNYNRTTGLSAITVGAWISGTGGRIINRGTNDILFLLSGGKLQVFINNGNPGVGTTNQVVSSNTWSHVAFTWSAGAVTIYVNGTAVPVSGSTAVSPINDSGASNLRFGAYTNDGTIERFTGQIDDVRIYSRLLTPGEIGSLYNNSLGCVAP